MITVSYSSGLGRDVREAPTKWQLDIGTRGMEAPELAGLAGAGFDAGRMAGSFGDWTHAAEECRSEEAIVPDDGSKGRRQESLEIGPNEARGSRRRRRPGAKRIGDGQ